MRPLILAAAIALLAPPAFAHPGGLAADGCHRERATGTRHCHGGGGGSSRPARPSSVRGLVGDGSSASGPFANCAAARAAGAAPVRRGQPGYSTGLDRDGDGVGCE